MVYLKEDGSLDVERINALPYEEYIKQIRKLTNEQHEEYLSQLPINENGCDDRFVMVDYTLEEDMERNGTVDFGGFLGHQ